MKKNILFPLLVSLFTLGALAACGGNSDPTSSSDSSQSEIVSSESSETISSTAPSSEEISSEVPSSEEISSETPSSEVPSSEVISSEISSEPISSELPSSEPLTGLQLVEYRVKNSRPTKIAIKEKYTNPELGANLSLNHNFTFEIEYGSPIKMKFDYSYQHLNPIGSDSMIGTTTGTMYASGSDVYQLVDSTYVPMDDIMPALLSTYLKLDDESYFSNVYYQEDLFTANVKDECVNDLLNNNYDITGMSLVIEFDDDLVSKIRLVYKSSAGADVNITSNYSYDIVNVTIDE